MSRRFVFLLLPMALIFGACDSDPATMPASDAVADATGDTTADISRDAVSADTVEDTTKPPVNICNPIVQTGCAADENCRFNEGDEGGTSCFAEGAKAYGDECGSTTECSRGTCTSLNDTGYFCYQYCNTSAHCASKDTCLELQDSVFGLCELPVEYETCDLMAQDCKGGKGCYLLGGEGAVCLPAGSAAATDGCTGVGDCAPGNTCINKICREWCDIGDPGATCPDALKPCVAQFGTVGYCDY